MVASHKNRMVYIWWPLIKIGWYIYMVASLKNRMVYIWWPLIKIGWYIYGGLS